jgi:hypothetical protein
VSQAKKFHVAVDLDDVCLDFSRSVVETFQREYGIDHAYDGDPWGPSMTALAKHPKILASGYKSWWDWLKARDWLWSTFGAVPGAIGGIQQLRAMGCYVECVTAKPEWAEFNVWKWLGKWRPAFHRVTIVTNGQLKIDFTEADVIVDDKLETCRQFHAEGRQAIWFSQAKEGYPLETTDGRFKVAWDWDHVLEYVREMVK